MTALASSECMIVRLCCFASRSMVAHVDGRYQRGKLLGRLCLGSSGMGIEVSRLVLGGQAVEVYRGQGLAVTRLLGREVRQA